MLIHLDHESAWQRMRQLVDQLVTSVNHAAFLDEVLDALVELLGADRGLVVLGDPGGGGQVVAARRLGRDLTPEEREEVSKTVMVDAATTGTLVVWAEGPTETPVQSMIDLSIKTAMAAPLRTASWWSGATTDAVRGVVYVDFRNVLTQVESLHREFFDCASNPLSSAIDQREKLAQSRRAPGDPAAPGGAAVPAPDLDELLRPSSLDAIRREVESCLHGTSPVLILGESGTGKTRLAAAMAEASGKKPVVRATLGASDDLNTITSELFGHERGAFSGAVAKRVGLVEFADGGTLILDEVLNLPLHAQQLLLDFTQFGTYRPLGHQAPEPKRANVRIFAATNGDLDQAVADGRFRQDLYYRLSAVPFTIPPLRERRQDIPAIAEGWLRRAFPDRRWKLSVQARRLMLSEELDWKGNVRQLEGVVQRARERALAEDPDADTLRPEHIEPRDLGRGAISVPAPAAVAPARPVSAMFQIEPMELDDSWQRLLQERAELDRLEREVITMAMRRFRGVLAHAAKELGVARTSLISRMRVLGLDKDADWS